MSYPKRRRVMAGNWKMYKTQAETRAFFAEFLPLVAGTTDCDIVIAPTFTAIAASIEATKGSNVAIGGQNLYWQTQGAFTGEVSAPQLVDAGCKFVILGHSERRQLMGELDAAVNLKSKAALRAGLSPIICVGETLPEREQSILHMRFVDGLTQSEIAAAVGVSQMHVSRLLSSSLQKLRDGIGQERTGRR